MPNRGFTGQRRYERQVFATMILARAARRLSGDGASQLDSLKSNMLNRIDLERSSRANDKLLDTSGGSMTSADLPDLRIGRRQGRTWSVPRRRATGHAGG